MENKKGIEKWEVFLLIGIVLSLVIVGLFLSDSSGIGLINKQNSYDNNGIGFKSYSITNSYKPNLALETFDVNVDNGLKISYKGYTVTYHPVFVMEDGTQYGWSNIPDTIGIDLWKEKIAGNRYKWGVDFSNVSTNIKDDLHGGLKWVALNRTSATKEVWNEETEVMDIVPITKDDIEGRIKIEGSIIIINNEVYLSHDDILRTYNIQITKQYIAIGGLDNSWIVCDEWDEEVCIENHTEYNWIDNGDTTWNISFDPIVEITSDTWITDSLLTNVTAEGGDSNFTHLNISNTAPWDSLVGYWNFDGDVVNTKLTQHYDFTKENNDGTGVADAVVNSTSCIYDDCLRLDGTGDYVDLGTFTNLNGATSLAVSMWVYRDEATFSSFDGIFTLGSSSQQVPWIIGRSGTDDVIFKIETTSGVDDINLTTAGFPSYTWTHIVATWNGSLAQVYFDGVADGTTDTSAGDTVGNTDGQNRIGSNNDFGDFNGLIDEVMVFSTSLTEAQILEIYNNQSSRFMKEGTQKIRAVNITNATTWDDNGDSRVNLTSTFDNNLDSNVSARIGQINFSTNVSDLVLYMPFEWGSAVDISGNGNDGTPTIEGSGDLVFSETGGLNDTGAFNFTFKNVGNGGSIKVPSSTQFAQLCGNTTPADGVQGCTMMAWVKKRDSATTGTVMSRYDASSSDVFFTFQVDKYERIVSTIDEDGGASGLCSVTSDSVVTLNKWDHVAMIYNVTNIAVYINGVQASSGLTSCSIQINETAWEDPEHFMIGGHDDGVIRLGYSGLIDEVMVFSRSLSPTELLDLYKNQTLGYNKAYYTPYENLISGANTTFTIDEEADFIFPDLQFIAGNSTAPFYSPLIFGDIILETFSEGGVEDTCTYDTGNWGVDCSNNCVITEDVDLGGNNISIIGTGTFTMNGANITNFGDGFVAGTDADNTCIIRCLDGGCLIF